MSEAGAGQTFRRYTTTSGWETVEARVTVESAVSLSVNGQPWLSFSCTPVDLEALAVGFLYNERVFEIRAELVVVKVIHQGTQVDVWLNHPVERPTRWMRTSGCTGGQTSVSEKQPEMGQPLSPPDPAPAAFSPLAILHGMEQLHETQELYRAYGGVHCSALSDGETIRLHAEDIGRHNTLDKLAGRMILDDVLVSPAIVLTTGRVSSEMLQKSARLGAGVVASRTSPTTQSVSLAEALGITLIGYARRSGFTVYTHPDRLAAGIR